MKTEALNNSRTRQIAEIKLKQGPQTGMRLTFSEQETQNMQPHLDLSLHLV